MHIFKKYYFHAGVVIFPLFCLLLLSNQNNKSCDSRSFHYDILENACGVSLHQGTYSNVFLTNLLIVFFSTSRSNIHFELLVIYRAYLCIYKYVFAVNGSRIEQFFSQNISKYFWWYICISPDSDGGCNQGFFDLQIRDLRSAYDFGIVCCITMFYVRWFYKKWNNNDTLGIEHFQNQRVTKTLILSSKIRRHIGVQM